MTARVGPARWRIVTPYGKFVYLFLASIAVAAVTVTASLTMGSWAGSLASVPLQLLVVGFAARNFRDAEIESLEAPREWWRMTARPLSGFVFGALFLVQAVWVTPPAFREPDAWAVVLGVLTCGLLGAALIRSSLRLRADVSGRSAGLSLT
ncbi:hypothetical protein [Cellulomonas sp.]|uniref:hypothetical protein n=1 Tax=Cellulomonas sp. TaxID=40001 RepID=UPI003BAB7D46